MEAYVYLILVDGVPRYVGKGRDNRVKDHMQMVRSITRRRAAGEKVRTTLFYNKLAKAWRDGSEIDEVIIVDGLTDEQAYEREIEEIAKYATLWNLDAGGLGRTSDSVARQWKRKGYRQKVVAKIKEVANRPENIARTSAQMKANHKELMIGLKAYLATPEGKAMRVQQAKDVWVGLDADARAQRIENMKLGQHQYYATRRPQRILAAIRTAPDGLTYAELGKALGEEPRSLKTAMKLLRDGGLIERRGPYHGARFYLTNVTPLQTA